MKQEIKEKWVKALRSDEYQQGAGGLHYTEIGPDGDTIDRFCCLGVLCDLASKEIPDLQIVQYPQVSGGVYYSYDYQSTALPVSVQRWAGLNATDPYIKDPTPSSLHEAALSDINDNGRSFGDISDIIEEQF